MTTFLKVLAMFITISYFKLLFVSFLSSTGIGAVYAPNSVLMKPFQKKRTKNARHYIHLREFAHN